MPLYDGEVARRLEDQAGDFEVPEERKESVREYRDAMDDVSSNYSKEEVEDALSEDEFPGALPTDEFDEVSGLSVDFDQSWSSHEEVNVWAVDVLENRVVVAADGSQIEPIDEFDQPVGLAQAVWLVNRHKRGRDYTRDVDMEVLTPEDLLYKDPNTGYVQVDEQEVSISRFELEMKVLCERIEEYADAERPPVVMYDGSLEISFIQTFDQKTQERYAEAMSRLLAASRHHEVPVVGFTSGSKGRDLAVMLEHLDAVDAPQKVRDFRVLLQELGSWGDRSVLFRTQRGSTMNRLSTSYHGSEYDFSDRLLFTYLNTGSGQSLDRVGIPKWVQEEGIVEDVLSTVRAQAAVGRGFPEILSAADADAVLSNKDRDRFLEIVQNFSEANDVDIRWVDKALNKRRRRR